MVCVPYFHTCIIGSISDAVTSSLFFLLLPPPCIRLKVLPPPLFSAGRVIRSIPRRDALYPALPAYTSHPVQPSGREEDLPVGTSRSQSPPRVRPTWHEF